MEQSNLSGAIATAPYHYMFNFSVSTEDGLTDEGVPANRESLALTRFIVQKLCVPLVVSFGVVSNILNIIVLTHRSMKTSTNWYLTVLALSDSLYLVFSLTLSFKHNHCMSETSAYKYWFPYGRVFTDMCSNVGVWLTITFTLERYIGVCHPIRGHVICTPQRAHLITAVVSLVAIAVTVPQFFEMSVVERLDRDRNATHLAFDYTPFSQTYSYKMGYHWFVTTATTFLPLATLCLFNGLLIRAVVKATKIRRHLSTVPVKKSCDRSGSEQNKITLMLVSVAIVFILCQFPGAILLLYKTYCDVNGIRITEYHNNEIKMAANVTNLLIQLNASINFLLYSFISTKFRRTFQLVVCRKMWWTSKYSQSETNIFRASRRTSGTVTWLTTRAPVVPGDLDRSLQVFSYRDMKKRSTEMLNVDMTMQEYSTYPYTPENSPGRQDSAFT